MAKVTCLSLNCRNSKCIMEIVKHNMRVTRCASTWSSNRTPQEERLTSERTRMAVQSFGLGGRSFLFRNHDDHRDYKCKERNHPDTKLYHKTHGFENLHWHHLLKESGQPPALHMQLLFLS